jgi:hypothetical protein
MFRRGRWKPFVVLAVIVAGGAVALRLFVL